MAYQFHPTTAEKLLELHRNDLLKEAEMRRLAREAAPVSQPVLPRLAGSLGSRLVSLGTWLMDYTAPTKPSCLPITSHRA